MNVFITYLKNFIREDFNAKYYFSVIVFSVLMIGINEYFNVENGYLDKLDLGSRILGFMLLYVGSYFLILKLNQITTSQPPIVSSLLWVKVLFGCALISFDAAWNIYSVFPALPKELSRFVPLVANNLISIFIYAIPMLLFYYFLDHKTRFYGLVETRTQLKPYLTLFAIVAPLVLLATFFEGFHTYYPLYRYNDAATYLNVPRWLTIAIYELAYGGSFVSIELIFRGFFVVGMVAMLGRHAVVPMAVVYCFIHFGKPVGECISALFGGYILGVIAYYTRSIIGGTIIHVGLAWMMELFAGGYGLLFKDSG